MISEAELVEIERRADRVETAVDGVLIAVAESLTRGGGWQEAVTQIDGELGAVAADIARMVAEIRAARKAVAA
ncbi:MAG TPA: hypothetical protein VME43_04960 [Bryobacteraceae bacterium]|nr:hypothetical protein [Bryobacteraceae bacterium]